MKLEKPKQTRVIGTAASLALMLALSGCGGGSGSGESEIEAKGPPQHSNSQGASISITNACELASIAGKPVLRVTTTIIDKTSGDYGVDFTDNGTTVRAKEKGKGKDTYEWVGEEAIFTGALGITVKDIQLCDGSGAYLGPDDTVSLNASVTVNVDNDNKGEYANRCSDDPDTDGIDEGKVVVSADELTQLCGS